MGPEGASKFITTNGNVLHNILPNQANKTVNCLKLQTPYKNVITHAIVAKG